MKRKFLICETCGNIIEMLNDSGVIPKCCGASMKELVPNTTDAATEKHIPIVTIENNIATVVVGSILHPMTEEHYIAWIEIETNEKIARKILNPNDKPEAIFTLNENEKIVKAYTYCNLHSLWMKEL